FWSQLPIRNAVDFLCYVERLLNHAGCLWCDTQRVQIFEPRPAYLAYIGSCVRLSRDQAAEIVDDYKVILHTRISISQNTLEHFHRLERFNLEAGFFSNLTNDGFVCRFRRIHQPAGD